MKMFKDLLKKFIVLTAIFVVAGFLYSRYNAHAAVTYQTPGAIAYSSNNGTSVSPAYPASISAGDLLVLIIGMKPSTANSGSVTTPGGWTASGSLTGAGGYGTTLGMDTGNTNVFAFYKVADGTESGSLAVTIATNNTSWAQMYRFSNATGSWSVAGVTGSDTTVGNVSITHSADPGVTAGDYILGAMVIPTDVTTPNQFSAEALSQTGITFGAVTEISEPDSNTGDDIGGVTYYSSVNAGTSSAAPTFTATAGGTTTNVRGPGIFIRIRESNTAPTLSVSQPDGSSDTVTVGDLYNITYSLADTDPLHAVTVAFYYDTDNSGLNGTAITGACATAAEGSGATCSWNTTGMTPGSYYVYGLTSDGIAAQVSAYSSGTITINAPSDTTPPTPNPMTFATAPANDSATQISMTATTATDASTPPVSYYFALDTTSCTGANVGTGAADSGWQSGTGYTDTGLDVNKCYGYKVKARDSVGTPNETGYSGITTLYTSANVPGTPTLIGNTPTTLSLTNAENSNPAANPTTNFAVQVVTTSPSDATWLNQWVNGSGSPSATAVWLTDAQLDALILQGLQTSTLYGVKVKARNNDSDETALSAEGQGTPTPTPTTTLGTGTDPATATVAPGSGIRDAGAFTLVTNTGTDTVTAMTVTLAGSGAPYAGLSEAKITSDDGSSVYFNTVTGFTGNTVSFSGGTSISVGTTPAQFKIRLTPLSHTAMPAPSTGTQYDFTAYASAFTATNTKVTSDDNANTLTIDNLSPGGTTGANAVQGNAQATVSWTNPGDGDFQKVIIYCQTASITDAPTEGTDPSVDGGSCDSTARVKYSGTASPQTFTGLSNGTTYYFRIYGRDTNGNFTAIASTQQVSATPSPNPTTTLATGSDPAAATIAPGASATDVNAFTLQTNTGTETITSVTVNLSTDNGIGRLAITNNTDTELGFITSMTAGSNVISVSNMSAGTSTATFKVRATPLSHTTMPVVPGAEYTITAPVTAWSSSAYTHEGSDTNSNALTIDNASPANVSSASGSAGDAQATVSWTNPGDGDFQKVIIYCQTASITDAPTEGTDPSVDGGSCDSTARVKYSGTASPQTFTGLSNGTAYYYKIFSKDANGNYAAGTDPAGLPFTPAATTFTISATSGANGTITPSGTTTVAQAGSQTYTITPASGYSVGTLTVDGVSVTASTSYTFSDVQANHTISATFTESPTFTISATSGANGTITPSGTTTVAQAGSQTYTITPASGYSVGTLTVDGVSVTASTSYTFSDVQANHTISATFTESPSTPATVTDVVITSTITGGAGGAIVVPPGTVTFMGKASPNGEISVIDRELRGGKDVRRTTITNSDGSFSLSFIGVSEGIHSFVLLAKDSMKRVSQAKFFFVDAFDQKPSQKNLILPPTIDLPVGRVSRGKTITIIGSGSPGDTIHLELDGIIKGEGIADPSGLYSFSLPTGALGFGTYTVRTRQKDVSSNQTSDFSVSRSFIVSNLSVVQTDINGDGKIDIKDWSIFLASFASRDKEVKKSIDFTGDGKVDIADFSIFIKTIRKK